MSIPSHKGHAYRFSKIYICLLGMVLNGSHLFLNITTWFRPCTTKHKDQHFWLGIIYFFIHSSFSFLSRMTSSKYGDR